MGDAADTTSASPAGTAATPEMDPVTLVQDTAAPSSSSPPTGAAAPDSKASSESGATKSNADSTRAAPRPSGLKPPSKIGRLCAHSAPKPAIPLSPRSADGGSAETLRKLSDDYSRKHLADLVEADEESEGCGAGAGGGDRAGRYHRKASNSSTFSVTSMDALWEKHPRRLSEAGLRRSSDHSVVLTEDTDSFIIGERVWVGGSKPGQIAYIGETQFAPGDWAGIVLDEPIGKNDGSVAGTRYFQCAERRGVFSRLTRLTRAPLYTPRSSHAGSPASDAGSVLASPASAAAVAAHQRRALSPNGSVRSAVSSRMNMSVTSTATAATGELRLGERVIVSSSRGSKAGTLRYTGAADFAPGLWCGVELDDPIGKNDGSVDGKRYFECAPHFGLFAPASKVSRSPSSRRPGACAVHSTGRPLRRSNSRDSLTSLGTSIASSVRPASRAGSRLPPAPGQRASGPRAASTPVSAKNALQELLREKQQHLERLMRERELERAEVAKVTLQADRSSAQLAHAVKQSALTASENETLKAELLRLSKQLEDERQRAEELLFRTEEDNINKEDYDKFQQAVQVERAAAEKRIQELEAEVALLAATTETTRAAAAAAGDKHTAELDTLHATHREEIQAAQMLSSELQKLLDEAYALLKEKENEKDSLGKSMTEELSRSRVESERALAEVKSKLSVAQTEFDAQMSVLNAKLKMAETKLETEKQNSERILRDNGQIISELNDKVVQTQAALNDKTHELNKVLGSSKEQELSLTKEITKLKMEISAKVLDLEQLTESCRKYETSRIALETELVNVKEDFTKKMNEYESILNETSQQNDKYLAEVSELRQTLVHKNNELEKVLNEFKESSSVTAKQVMEYKELLSERDKEIEKLKHEYEETAAKFNKNHAIIADEHKKLIDDRNLQIEKLVKELENHQQIIEKNKKDFDMLTSKVNSNVDEIKLLVDENVTLKSTISNLTTTISDLNAKIDLMSLEKGELERQLNSSSEKCSELQKAKEKVEAEYLNLTSHSSNSNEEINKLTQYLRETEKELQELRDKFREKFNDHQRVEQELNQQLSKRQQEFELEKEVLNNTIAKTLVDLSSSQGREKELDAQIVLLNEKSTMHDQSFKEILNEKVSLEKIIESCKKTEIELQIKLESAVKESEITVQEYKQKIELMKSDCESSEIEMKTKLDQLVQAQNDLNTKLEQAHNNEDMLQKKLEELTNQFSTEKSDLNKELRKKDLDILALKDDIQKSVSEGTHINSSIEEKDNIIKDLNMKLAMVHIDIDSNIDVIAEKERQIAVSGQELSKCLEEKQAIEGKLGEYIAETKQLQQKLEILTTEKTDLNITIKEQQDKIELLTRDIDHISNAKSDFETQCQSISKDFSQLNTQYQDILKLAENNNEIKVKMENVAQEKDNLIKAETQKLVLASANIKSLEEENENLKRVIADKNLVLDGKEKHLAKLEESLQVGNSETNSEIERLSNNIDQINKLHKSEVETLQNKINTLESNSKMNEINLDNLNKKNELILELQAMLLKTEADIKQLSDINEGQKTNYEDLNRQLQSEYNNLKKENKKERHALKDNLHEVKKSLQESNEKLNIEISKQSELQRKLEESEKRAQELANKVELQTVNQTSSRAEQDNLLEKLTLELQAVRKNSADIVSRHEQTVNDLKIEVENKINDLLKKDARISKLEEELKSQKAKTEIAQREKQLMQHETAVKEKESIRSENYDNGHSKGQGDDNAHKLLEEKQLVEGQVDFLNSVIVDMQRKNEQLLARVQALETGFSPDSVSPNHFHFDGKKKEVAPRLFCDICDVFDAHDTEDCPRQAADPPAPPPAAAAAARKPPPPPRPYCDICEVFGHATENCDEEETF